MPSTAPDDDRLALQAAKNRSAFAELYRRYVRRVYAYQLARTGDVQSAQDLTSQTFLSALESIHTFRGPGSFAGWIMAIAHHKMAAHYRGLRGWLSLSEAENRPDLQLSLEASSDQNAQVRQVSRALRQISSDRAEAVLLRLFAGLSTQETAAVMCKSEAAVKMLLLRGLQDLRSRLGVQLQVEEECP